MFRLVIQVPVRAARKRNRSEIRCYSSWTPSGLSWPTTRLPSKDGENVSTKESMETQMKKEILEALVTEHVRLHLAKKFPSVFSRRSGKALLSPVENTVGETMETLAALSGYERVELPLEDDVVFLAEGITVRPSFYQNGTPNKSIFMFAQRIDDPFAHPCNFMNKKFPVLQQEDFRLYRILENVAENTITSIYNSVRQTFTNTFVKPLDKLSLFFIKKHPKKVEQKVVSVPNGSPGQLQNLIVLSNDGAVLITHMYPSVHLLALPYTMGHKSASTLISVSLVVFGAVPLAYRSLRFAMDYPLLSEAIAASLVGTIMYGIWSGRSISRTRQSEVASQGISSRIYARDDAVLWALQEGAIKRVSMALLQTYYNELNNLPGSTSVKQFNPSFHVLDIPQLLRRMGLLLPSTWEDCSKHVAVDLDGAIAALKSRLPNVENGQCPPVAFAPPSDKQG